MIEKNVERRLNNGDLVSWESSLSQIKEKAIKEGNEATLTLINRYEGNDKGSRDNGGKNIEKKDDEKAISIKQEDKNYSTMLRQAGLGEVIDSSNQTEKNTILQTRDMAFTFELSQDGLGFTFNKGELMFNEYDYSLPESIKLIVKGDKVILNIFNQYNELAMVTGGQEILAFRYKEDTKTMIIVVKSRLNLGELNTTREDIVWHGLEGNESLVFVSLEAALKRGIIQEEDVGLGVESIKRVTFQEVLDKLTYETTEKVLKAAASAVPDSERSLIENILRGIKNGQNSIINEQLIIQVASRLLDYLKDALAKHSDVSPDLIGRIDISKDSETILRLAFSSSSKERKQLIGKLFEGSDNGGTKDVLRNAYRVLSKNMHDARLTKHDEKGDNVGIKLIEETYTIMFACINNIFRSVLSEYYFSYIDHPKGVDIFFISCGIAKLGQLNNPYYISPIQARESRKLIVKSISKDKSINIKDIQKFINDHQRRQLSETLLNESDLVVVFGESVLKRLNHKKVALLTGFLPKRDKFYKQDIPDLAPAEFSTKYPFEAGDLWNILKKIDKNKMVRRAILNRNKNDNGGEIFKDNLKQIAYRLSRRKLRLFAFDYDDNLAPAGSSMSKNALKELLQIPASGKHLAIVSGRSMERVGTVLGLEEIFVSFIPKNIRIACEENIHFLLEAGGSIWYFDRERVVLNTSLSKTINPKLKVEIIAAIKENIAKLVGVETEIVIRRSEVALFIHEKNILTRRKYLNYVRSNLVKTLKNKSLVIENSSIASDVTVSSKSEAILGLSKRVDVPLSRVLVSGDSANDFDMLALPDVTAIYSGDPNILPEYLKNKVILVKGTEGLTLLLEYLRAAHKSKNDNGGEEIKDLRLIFDAAYLGRMALVTSCEGEARNVALFRFIDDRIDVQDLIKQNKSLPLFLNDSNFEFVGGLAYLIPDEGAMAISSVALYDGTLEEFLRHSGKYVPFLVKEDIRGYGFGLIIMAQAVSDMYLGVYGKKVRRYTFLWPSFQARRTLGCIPLLEKKNEWEWYISNQSSKDGAGNLIAYAFKHLSATKHFHYKIVYSGESDNGGEIKIRNNRYGFPLQAFWYDTINHEHTLYIDKEVYQISNFKYLRVDSKDRILFFATHHQAAYYFTLLLWQEGIVNGYEEFLHIDRTQHPDNAPWNGETIQLSDSFLDELDKAMGHKRFGIQCNNYITALNKQFPQMNYEFLGFIKSSFDWGGATFDKVGSVFNFDRKTKNSILSADLDIVLCSSDKGTSKRIVDKLIDIAGESKIVMFFTSPTFLPYFAGTELSQELINRLVDNGGDRKIENLNFGFRLRSSRFDYKDRFYSIYSPIVAGERMFLSNHQYIRISLNDKDIFCATHHNAAFLFTLMLYKEGKITGNEIFAHFDRGIHNDAQSWNGEIINLDKGIGDVLELVVNDRSDLSCGNYITALQAHFTGMEYAFFAQSEIRDASMFNWASDIINYKGNLKNSIASIDLDLFLNVGDKYFEELIIDKLIDT
ncbi:MAG: HAD hydrolase family protein, partial [Parcubacteria group bacterium]|nr:HAD hydrolase family protein [Parcubacteria group bacterium]